MQGNMEYTEHRAVAGTGAGAGASTSAVPCRVCIVLILLRCKVRWRIPFHLMTVGWYCYCLVFPDSLTVSHQQLEAITECHHRCEICLSTSPPQRIIISLELTLIPMPLSMSMTMTMLTEFCYVAFVVFFLFFYDV